MSQHPRPATAVTGDTAITLAASDESGVALPGEGKGKQAEPVLDQLSALIAVMNDKYGAELAEPDKIWIDQQKGRTQGRRRHEDRHAQQRPQSVRAGPGE